jgi:parallel beta-helix repeat protein
MRRRRRRGTWWWQGCEGCELVSGAGVGDDTGGFGFQAIAAVKFLWWEVGLMNDTLDVILVNRCNQNDEFRTVLPAKKCVRVLLILMLAAAAVLVVGAGVGAAATTWYVDDGGGAGIDFTNTSDAVDTASNIDLIYKDLAESIAPEEEWNKTFGGAGGQCANSVQQTSDGGYIMASGLNTPWLIKTDSNGNQLWRKWYGGPSMDVATSVQQTSDSGYILTGFTYSYIVDLGVGSNDFLLVKTDPDGIEQWNKTFGGKSDDYAYSVKQTTDAGYVLAGRKICEAGNSDAWLIKTDGSGNEQWNKTFGGISHDMIYSVQQTSDDGYILAGSTSSYGVDKYDSDAWLIKTDENGNEQWNKTFGETSYEEIKSVQQTIDGGYILAGYINTGMAYDRDAWLIKTNENGNEQWNKTFGENSFKEAYSVQQTIDGGYILAGHTFEDGSCAWLVKTDAKGNEQWNKTFKGNGSGYARSVQQTIDGGYILAGGLSSVVGEYEAWLIKVAGEPAKETEYWAVIVGGTATMSYEDATCLYNALMSSSNWKDDHIQVLVDDDATYWDIRSAIEDWMASQADSDDVCLFFFSGHGGVDAEYPDNGYIFTSDGTVIDDNELKVWLKKLPTDDVVVILHSCHSGAFIENIKEDVHVVLTACGTTEESSVHGYFENGLLPFYVTQGLLGAADTDKNKKISVEELIDFSKERHNPAQFSDKYPTTDLSLLVMPPTSGIQKMVEDAEAGDTIEISGTYNEHVIIDKTLTIIGNDATIENSFGCFYISADGVTINGFTLKDGRYGIYLDSSNNSILFNNNVSNNIGGGGICLLSSNKTTIHNNTASNNSYFGITLFSSNDNIMTDNNISYTTGYPRSAGISLNFAGGNMIKNNDITENKYGIMSLDSFNNLIYHNDLINNVDVQAYDMGNTNLWDNDYPSGGNYWSDYGAKYLDAEEIDASGIWDTPYDISGRAGAQDHYPLMHPWTGDTSQKGDLNSDGILTPADAAIALWIAATGAHDDAADVSGDGSVTSLDALMILQAAADAVDL